VNVFCDRIAGLLSALPHQAGVMLGHVLAHELTHVLQRVVRHSDTGIMQAHWTVRDLSAMSPKPLPFTPHDVYLIRDGIRRLTSAHAGAAPGGAPAVALTASTIAQERNP
jgi:predicted Zn-dependent protease